MAFVSIIVGILTGTTLATNHILKGACPTHLCWISTTNPLLAARGLSPSPFLMAIQTRMENTIRWISIVLHVWCVNLPESLRVGSDAGVLNSLKSSYMVNHEEEPFITCWQYLRDIGIYATLFVICIRVLLTGKGGTRKVLIACAMMMFALATVDVVLELSFLFWFVVKQYSIPEERLHFKFLIFITSK